MTSRVGPLCRTRLGLHYHRDTAVQVLGTDVPSYRNFPYRASDVLHLYRSFLQLIHRAYAPEERPDLLFRLRNEFAAKRHLSGYKLICAAIRRGEGILALQRQLLDAREARQRSLASTTTGAQSVDGLWEQLQLVSGKVLPGLRNNVDSLSVSRGGYGTAAGGEAIRSRRR